MKRRGGLVLAASVVVATASIFACSLRDTSYLQAGGGTTPPNEAGPDTVAPPRDGGPTRTATVVAGEQVGPNHLTQDALNLYWVTADGAIMSIKKDGSEPTSRKLASAGPGVIALGTADSAPLFYSKDLQVFVVQKTASGDAPGTPIGAANPTARSLVVDSEFLFAMAEEDTSDIPPQLIRFQHDGGAPTVLRVADQSLFMTAVAIHGNDVFWDEAEGTFYSLPKSSPPDAGPTAYATTGKPDEIESASYPAGFAVDQNAFFYTDSLSVRSHARLPSSAPRTLIDYPNASGSVIAIAIDDRYVYAIESAAAGTLRRNTKDGTGAPELMLDGLRTPSSFVVDGNAVYVALEGPPGQIVKCAK